GTPGAENPYVIFRLLVREITNRAGIPIEDRHIGSGRGLRLELQAKQIALRRESRIVLGNLRRFREIDGWSAIAGDFVNVVNLSATNVLLVDDPLAVGREGGAI